MLQISESRQHIQDDTSSRPTDRRRTEPNAQRIMASGHFQQGGHPWKSGRQRGERDEEENKGRAERAVEESHKPAAAFNQDGERKCEAER